MCHQKNNITSQLQLSCSRFWPLALISILLSCLNQKVKNMFWSYRRMFTVVPALGSFLKRGDRMYCWWSYSFFSFARCGGWDVISTTQPSMNCKNVTSALRLKELCWWPQERKGTVTSSINGYWALKIQTNKTKHNMKILNDTRGVKRGGV